MGVIKPLEEPQELAGERDNTGPATCLCDVGGGVERGKNPQVQKPEMRERHVPAGERGMTA